MGNLYRNQKRWHRYSVKHTIHVIQGFSKLTCHGKGKEGEKSHIPSRNLSVRLFVHRAHHLLPNMKVGTPHRALFPILSFVDATVLMKACCPTCHWWSLPLYGLTVLCVIIQSVKCFFPNPYFQLFLILYFSPFFLFKKNPKPTATTTKTEDGWEEKKKHLWFVALIL